VGAPGGTTVIAGDGHDRQRTAQQEQRMLENPFVPHTPAPTDAFVDREREVELIFGHLKAVQRGNVAVSGPLGIGKTSLLRYVADPAVAAAHGLHQSTHAIVYLDTQSVTPFGADRFWRRVVRLLERAEIRELAAPVSRLLERPAIDVLDLEEFLDALSDQDVALVLLLDEFEWALQAGTPEAESESRNFLAQLASLARRAPRVLALVVATSDPLPDVVRVINAWRGSPFPTIFTSVVLKPLGRAEADHLLDRALDGSEVPFGEEDRKLLYSLSGGQPAALQAAAFSLFHGRQLGMERERLWEAAQAAAERARATPGRADTDHPVPDRVRGAATIEEPSGLWIDEGTGDVLADGNRIDSLTALEYNLLRLLYGQPGRLCSKGEIIRHVWGDEFADEVDDSRVEKLISRLRRKIEPVPGRPQYIRTVRGRGYRFVP
jgi:hypothetical protein